MIESGVFRDKLPLVLEFGAGKGYLSSTIADCTDVRDFVFVDNQAFKLKVPFSLAKSFMGWFRQNERCEVMSEVTSNAFE